MSDYFRVVIPKSVNKDLKKIPLPWQDRIFKAIDFLEKDPFSGEKLWGKLLGKRRLRVPLYRIIYTVEKKKKLIILCEVGHRQGIY